MPSSYNAVEINIATGENKSRSKQWASQSLVNLYIDSQQTGRTARSLLPWPGETFFAGTREDKQKPVGRGMHVLDGFLYAVFDRSLYRITTAGVFTEVATIPGSKRVSFADDGFNMVIRVEGTVAYINGKFILQGNGATYLYNPRKFEILAVPEMPNDDEFVVTLVDNPREFYSGIGAATLTGDSLSQVYVYEKKIIMAGPNSIEFFYDDPQGGNPPIFAIEQASTSQIGVASSYSMAETPSFLYLLGSDNVVYRLSNFDLQSVTPSSIAKEIRETDTTDAYGFTCQIDGQWFYVLQMPKGNVTLAYSEATNTWTRLSTGNELDRHMVSGYVYAYGKHLIQNNELVEIFEWDFDAYSSDGNPIVRQFQTAPINGLSLGAPGKRMVMNRCRFIMESGVGNADDPEPNMMVRPSIDGGRTFGREYWPKLKRSSDTATMVDWYHNATFYDLVLSVRVTDPVFTAFHSAVIEIKAGGD